MVLRYEWLKTTKLRLLATDHLCYKKPESNEYSPIVLKREREREGEEPFGHLIGQTLGLH